MQELTCPECRVVMRPVRVSAHYHGQAIQVEQCASCGGLWFDRSEQHRVSVEHIESLDPYDERALLRLHTVRDGACPKDGAGLRRFVDVQFPKNIVIETCDVCGGLWFNRGEYCAYRRFFEHFKKRQERKDADHESPVQHLTRAFMHFQRNKEVRNRKRLVMRTLSVETMKSLLVFLFSGPVGGLSLATLYLVPLAVVLQVLLRSEHGFGIQVDMEEFKRLVSELQAEQRKRE